MVLDPQELTRNVRIAGLSEPILELLIEKSAQYEQAGLSVGNKDRVGWVIKFLMEQKEAIL